MNKPKISVILPIYNVEPYLEECLDSILNQTIIDDLEVIMVDDGSTDHSRYTVEKYALDYENFHAYHKANEGSAIARNYGLELAKGEYIHFCDPDDYIKNDFYERMYELARSSPDSNFVAGNSIRFGNYNIWKGILYKTTFENIGGPIQSTNIRENVNLVWDTGVWNKLIKKDFLDEKNIRFPNENIASQDLVFTIQLHCLTNHVAIDPSIFYYWRFRQSKNSITQQKEKIKSFNDRLRVIELMKEFFNENGIEKEIIEAEYDKWLNHDLKEYVKRIKDYPIEYHEEKIFKIKNVLKDIPDHIKENLNSYKQIIYRMIENEDYEGLLSFSYLENDLMKNPKLFETVGEEYKQCIDQLRDAKKEELRAEKENIESNDEEILIDYSSYIPYIDGDDFTVTAAIVDNENNEYPIANERIEDKPKEDGNREDYGYDVESAIKTNRLIIPLDLIKNLNHSRIKIKHESEDLSKETFLKNDRRKTFIFEKFDADIGIGIDKELYIDIREKNDNKVMIKDVIKEDEKFILLGSCQEKIEDLRIKNIVKFNEKTFPVKFLDDDEISQYSESVNKDEPDENIGEFKHDFIVEIPIGELLNETIKKWEIGSSDVIDNIKISENLIFYTPTYKIQIRNMRNKIQLEYSIADIIKELYNYNEQNAEANEKNKELRKKNKEFRNKNKEIKKKSNEIMKKNKRLKKKNEKLNEKNRKLKHEKDKAVEENKELNEKNRKQKEKINEYKSRKAVRFVDMIKSKL